MLVTFPCLLEEAAMSLPVVDFYYDIVSPYSYIAAARCHELDGLAHVRWRPCLLGGIFKATGNTGPAFVVPAKKPYMFADLERLCAYYGLPFRQPDNFPMNSVTVQRCLCAASDDQLPALTMKLYDAYWGRGLDVSDPAVLLELVGASLLAQSGSDAAKARLREHTEAAVALGAFGAPTFAYEGDIYFGADRLFLLADRLRRV